MNVTFRFCFRSPLKSLKLPVFKGLSTDLGSHSFLHISFYPLYQLPAGSITGAPKDKTMQIIHEAEGYDRGFYTGIMGIYDQGELNSAVMIRFVEEEASPSKTEKGKNSEVSRDLYFKAGGGITSKSDCRKEYEEVIQKIYLPIQENPSSEY